MHKNLSHSDQLIFIKLCIENPNISDMGSTWLCGFYERDHNMLDSISAMLYRLGIIESLIPDGECVCNSFLSEHWPAKAVEGYWERHGRNRKY